MPERTKQDDYHKIIDIIVIVCFELLDYRLPSDHTHLSLVAF